MRKKIKKAIVLALLSVGGTVGCSSTPPKQSELVADFHAHQRGYEDLRDMLLADKKLLRVTPDGVETTKSGLVRIVPPTEGVSGERYNRYLALFRETGAKGVFQWDAGQSGNIGIAVWGSGWGGDTRHIALVWMEQRPASEVDSLDAFYRSPKPRSPVFSHIEGDWYLWADW